MSNNIDSKKFNKVKYNNDYNKSTYKNMAVRLRPDDFNLIDDYCKETGVSKAKLIVNAIKYCIDNNIDLKADNTNKENLTDK